MTVGPRPHLVTGERVRLRFLESSNDCCHQLKLEEYSERAMKIVLVTWVAHKAGMQYSIPSSSISTVPYSMKNSITCFQLSPDLQQLITTPCILLEKWEYTTVLLCYSTTKMRICGSQLHCIEFNAPGTNFSINSYEEKSRALHRVTDRTTLF